MSFLKKLYCRLTKTPYTEEERSQYTIDRIRAGGGHVGENVVIYNSDFDLGEPYYISIGNNVTITGVKLLTHDASTKRALGYTKTGKVIIGNDVFIGHGSIILSNTVIGNRVIIGAGTIVAKDVPDNVVVCGNPMRVICSYDEYMEKNKKKMESLPVIDLYPAAILKDPSVIEQLKNAGSGYLL